jgi:hypothetical protein
MRPLLVIVGSELVERALQVFRAETGFACPKTLFSRSAPKVLGCGSRVWGVWTT